MRLEEMIVRTLWPYKPILSVESTGKVTDESYTSSAMDVLSASVSLARKGPAETWTYDSVVGALQVDLPHEAWQVGVLQLARKAESIVMIMAGTPGLRWEFQQLVLNSEYREKLILLVPPRTEDETANRLGDEPTVRWRKLLGDGDLPRVGAMEVLLRTVAIKFDKGGGGVLLTAGEHSPAAYQLALHLAQLPIRLWSPQAKELT